MTSNVKLEGFVLLLGLCETCEMWLIVVDEIMNDPVPIFIVISYIVL